MILEVNGKRLLSKPLKPISWHRQRPLSGDKRGTIYGIYDVSAQIGVSPCGIGGQMSN
jgi:hypothetical protein